MVEQIGHPFGSWGCLKKFGSCLDSGFDRTLQVVKIKVFLIFSLWFDGGVGERGGVKERVKAEVFQKVHVPKNCFVAYGP